MGHLALYCFLSSLYILNVNPLSEVQREKFVSCYVGLLFTQLTVSVAVWKPFIFMRFHLLIASLNSQVNENPFRNSFATPVSHQGPA